jgi:glycerol uptake facilitator-like aquaporin
MTRTVGTAENRGALDTAAQCKKSIAVVELIATVSLAFSTIIAVTAVSIGIARAEAFTGMTSAESAPLAIALFIGLLLTVMGGFTAIMTDGAKPRR